MSEIASAYVSLLPSAKGFGSKLNSELGGEIPGSAKSLGSKFGKLFALAGGALAAAGIGSFLKDSVAEAREAQKVSAATTSIIKATGGAANLTSKQIGSLTSALSAKTAVDDEQIQAGANILLTFKNVKREGKGLADIFGRATAAGLDLAAAGFGSVEGNAVQLGKALNDPLKGIAALAKSGVTFTEGQKKQIEGFVKSNDLLSAQKIILGEIENQVGGTAAATATSGEKAAVAFGNLKEQIGTALLPVIDRVATTLSGQVIPAISGFITGIQTGAGAGGTFASVVTNIASKLVSAASFVNQNRTAFIALAATLGVVTVATQIYATVVAVQAAGGLLAMVKATNLVRTATAVYTGVQWLLNAALTANPVGIVVVAIAALVAGVIIAYKKSDTFRGIVDKLFAGLKRVWGVLMQNKQAFLILLGPVGLVAAALITAYKRSETFRNGVNAVIGALKSFGSAVISAVTQVIKFQVGVAKVIVKVVKFFVELPGKILGAISGLATSMYNAGAELMQRLADGIKDKLDAVIGKIKGAADKIKGFFPGSPVREGPLKSFNGGHAGRELMVLLSRGIADGGPMAAKEASKAAQKVHDAIVDKLDKLRDKLKGFKDDFASIASGVADGFRGNLFDAVATEAVVGADGVVTAVAQSASQNFISGLMSKRGELQALTAAFKKLVGWGLSPNFLGQLFQSGNGALILDLAAGDQATAQQGQALFGDINSLSNQLGNSTAKLDTKLVDKMSDVRDEIRQTNKKLDKLADRTGDAVGQRINSSASNGKRNKRGDRK